MKKVILLAMLLAYPAMAQDVTLRVTNQELEVIGKGLGTQPFNDVAPIMSKLQAQIIEQRKAAEEAQKKAEEKKPVEPQK